jgi:hypothetical protein
MIFASGDPNAAAETCEFSDCTVLSLAEAMHPGHVRILYGGSDGRACLLMRPADTQLFPAARTRPIDLWQLGRIRRR